MSLQIPFRDFVDESVAMRNTDRQEYLIGTAVIPADQCDSMRSELRPLLLPGQRKLHWSGESETRRRAIVKLICELIPVLVLITHLSERHRKAERFRRKCLEVLYYEMVSLEVSDLSLESRSWRQDGTDRAHIVALQSQGLDRQLRIGHLRGEDEPLLWIADALLGAVNSAFTGKQEYFEALSPAILVNHETPDSLIAKKSERP